MSRDTLNFAQALSEMELGSAVVCVSSSERIEYTDDGEVLIDGVEHGTDYLVDKFSLEQFELCTK